MPDQPFTHEVDFDPEALTDAQLDAVGVAPTVTFGDPGFDADSLGYWGFGMGIHYQWDSGLRLGPLATSARTKVAVWRAHSEVTFKIITCAAARVMAVPQMPHVDTGDPNDVLLSRQISLPSRECFPDGSEMVVVVQQLVYLMQMAQDINYPVVFPNSTLRVNAPLQLDPSQFSRLLHGPPVPPGDFSGSKIEY